MARMEHRYFKGGVKAAGSIAKDGDSAIVPIMLSTLPLVGCSKKASMSLASSTL